MFENDPQIAMYSRMKNRKLKIHGKKYYINATLKLTKLVPYNPKMLAILTILCNITFTHMVDDSNLIYTVHTQTSQQYVNRKNHRLKLQTRETRLIDYTQPGVTNTD